MDEEEACIEETRELYIIEGRWSLVGERPPRCLVEEYPILLYAEEEEEEANGGRGS